MLLLVVATGESVIYGLMTGIGTIDRLKKKAANTMSEQRLK
jgi:hypothetical protein